MSIPRAYYNEFDVKAAAWLRQLIKGGHIAPGDVDERSIEDVQPSDLDGYSQHHFFAGIGGWSYALRLAGWPDDRPVWTGSCPCQPFSSAGKGGGFNDERHLWPAWQWLIQQYSPNVIFGEQVASKGGRNWFDLVSSDLEILDYATGAVDMCAAGIGAPHIRQRLYWVGHTNGPRLQACHAISFGNETRSNDLALSSTSSKRADPPHQQSYGRGDSGRGRREFADDGIVGNTHDPRLQGRSERRDGTDKWPTWSADLVNCRDGKRRPVEPGTFPLAHGVPGRVGLLRGYGNAIVPQVAAEFIGTYLDIAG